MDGFFTLSRDYLIIQTTMMGNERFMITIIVFLFALGLEDYSMNMKGLSNLYKISMVSFFCTVIT